MSSVTDLDANGPRIPAWRRFGLKLKSEQQPLVASMEAPEHVEHSKRKRDEATDEEAPKKAKKNKKIPRAVEESAPATPTPRLARKKSVAFTPETKAEDGDSIKQLFTSWVAEQKLHDPDFQLSTSAPVFQTPEPPKVVEQVDPELDEKVRRVKRVKKAKQEKSPKIKSQKKSNDTKPVTPSHPFLEYLKQYSESRATWKFNKNHQNHIIKHIFNLEIVPLDYTTFIYTYVRGLQGGVRTRVRDAALAVKVKDLEDGAAGFPEDMAQLDKKQQEYEGAMKEYIAAITLSDVSSKMGYEEGIMLNLSDKAMETRVAKRMRAERILVELATSPDGSTLRTVTTEENENQKRLRMNDGSTQKVARKRKQRTVTAEDESSSSSSSSSDSSDSDDSNSEDSTLENGVDDTSSSSSSSSSSSESESDSESGSEHDSEGSSGEQFGPDSEIRGLRDESDESESESD